MPELPETETIARALDALVRGAEVSAVVVYRDDVLRECDRDEFARRLTGVTIDRCWRRAKCVVLDISSGDELVVTPRFTGGLFVERGAMQLDGGDYTVLQLRLSDGRTLRYRDVRRLGTVALMDRARFDSWSASYGPDALDESLTAVRFSGFLRVTRRAVKTVLMDQRVIAGVGNIYANEALWAARIAPGRPARDVTRGEAGALLRNLRRILQASIALGGTTFRDYRDPEGKRGRFTAKLKVYGRAGEPCARCGATLVADHRHEGRVSVQCPECQS